MTKPLLTSRYSCHFDELVSTCEWSTPSTSGSTRKVKPFAGSFAGSAGAALAVSSALSCGFVVSWAVAEPAPASRRRPARRRNGLLWHVVRMESS